MIIPPPFLKARTLITGSIQDWYSATVILIRFISDVTSNYNSLEGQLSTDDCVRSVRVLTLQISWQLYCLHWFSTVCGDCRKSVRARVAMALLKRMGSLRRSNRAGTYSLPRRVEAKGMERSRGMVRCHITLLDDTVFTCDIDVSNHRCESVREYTFYITE